MTAEPRAIAPVAQPKRGQTVIADRVRHRLIEHAALSVPGVARHRTVVPGRTLPAVHTDDGAHSPAVEVEIAATWPVDGAEVRTKVEAAVAGELSRSLDEQPRHVGVRIGRIISDRTPAQVFDAYADDAAPSDAKPAGRQRKFAPRRIAAATFTGVVIALAVTTVGVLGVRDALISFHWIGGDAWITHAVGRAGDAHWQWWTWPVAVVAVLAGFALLIAAVKPRRWAYHPVGEGVWVQRQAVADWRSELTREPADKGGDET